jgi:hypothetical protein
MDEPPHFRDPFALLYTSTGELEPCYGADQPFDLTFNRNSPCKRKGIRSKIPQLSIGDVRQSFIQLRLIQDQGLTPDTMLFNGMTAGQFSLLYIVRTYSAKKSRAKKSGGKGSDAAVQGVHRKRLHGRGDGESDRVGGGAELLPRHD